jgi:RNA polymerase sigma-70 factor (ECF subfamily)
VKDVPGTLHRGGEFATTHWSAVAACDPRTDADPAETDAAVAQLCRDYWPPLYSFVRRRGYAQADAQDLVQGFFSHLLESRIYAQADSAKGRFRTFLLRALKNYLTDVREKEQAAKRGGRQHFVVLDTEIAAVEKANASAALPADLDEEWHYEQRWATALVSRALAGLRADFSRENEKRIFAKLEPFVCGGAALPRQDEVARQLGMPLDTFRSHLSRARARYRAILRAEVARTIGTADDVDEELRQLSRILIAAA